MKRAHVAAAAWAALTAIGCAAAGGDERSPIAAAREPLIYGDDDRRDWYEVDDAVARELAARSSVAFVDRLELMAGDDGGVQLTSATWAETADLCDGQQRFAAQPSAAQCSGVLIDHDLVLSAAHCLRALPCEEWRLVFGYHYEAEDRLRALAADDVYACSEVIALEYPYDRDSERVDYALLRLDRSVTPQHVPARIPEREEGLSPGAPVVVIGNGAGLPTKIDAGGRVADARIETLDYFTTDSDNFGGGSGSGVFDSSGALRGVVARGGLDYQMAPEGCAEVRRSDAGPSAAEEQVTYAARAREGLCANDPQRALCGTRPTRAPDCSAAPARHPLQLAPWLALALWIAERLGRRRGRRHRGQG